MASWGATVRRAPIADQQTTMVLGLAATAVGTWLIWSAYEARGKGRPFALRFWPGG